MAIYDPQTSLDVKDGNGVVKQLSSIVDGAHGHVTFHGVYGSARITSSAGEPAYVVGSVGVNNFPASQTVTASLINRVGVTGTVEINNFPSTQTVTAVNGNPVYQTVAYGNAVTTASISTVNYDNSSVGSFQICDFDATRKELIIHNSGPGNLYIKMSPSTQPQINTFGFNTGGNTLVKNKIPTNYNFVIYPSGTYMTSEASRVMFYAGFYVSGSTPLTGTVQFTGIS